MTQRLSRSLECRGPKAPLSADELQAMAMRCWIEQGVLVIRPDDVINDFDKQHIINIGNSIFGKRRRPTNGE